MSSLQLLAMALLATTLQAVGSSARAADTIVVGRSLALSGPLQSCGEAKRDGGDAYIGKVNASGALVAGRWNWSPSTMPTHL